MADRQQFIIEGIAKIDNVLDGIKKIQAGLGGLKVPDNLQKQFENLYKKAIDQGDKAKKALSSGFETKGAVKEYTAALEGISRIYGEILNKTKGLKVDKDFLSVNFDSLDKANKELERLEGELNVVKKEAENAKRSAQKVFTGVANYYGDTKHYKNPFKEWGEAATALKNNDIPGVKAALDALEQKFQGKNTDTGLWAKRYEAFQKLQDAFTTYQQQLSKVVAVDQQVTAQQQVVNVEIDNAAKSLDPLVELMERAAKESDQFADSEGKAARGTQELNSELEHFKNKAAYFFGISNAVNLFKRAVRSAYDTVKDLDAVMTETAVVTNFSVGDMWSQLPEYTARANELGVSIHSAYEAATIFYQQGLKTNEVMAVSNETLKMARIAGLDAATASDRMTNALRGFNMEMDQMSAQRVNDVYSELAAITASDTDEISTAMTKVASLAHNANMEFETTAAFLAQIIESTRESAETAGTALKTVVARFSEVKNLYSKGELLGQDEEGEEIDVNRVSTALRSAGINLNEYLTGAKGLDDIFMELAEKWDDLDIVQQRYIATMAAGSRQQSRFIALMSDYKRTVELVNAANNAEGASQEQYNKTLESLETKLSRLKNAWDEFVLGLANSDVIKGAVDLLTDLITAINNVIKAVSGKNAGAKMITTFFTAFTTFKFGAKLIGKNSGISKFLAGFVGADANQLVQLRARDLAKMFYSSLAEKIADPTSAKGLFKDNIAGDIFKYLSVSNKDFYKKLFSNSNFDFSVGEDKLVAFTDTIGSGLSRGTLTIDELNQALKACGQTIEVTKENAADFGLVVDGDGKIVNKATGEMRRLSAAAIAAGGALMAFGSWMENFEGPAKNVGTVIKGLGAGLLAFGTIMSVYLPLQAQLMAKKVTSAIVSIPVVGWIAGIISAIIALTAAISGLVKNNSLETKLEEASANAKAAADAANEAKEAYEKLGETWNSLDEKYDAIENATRGTQEWRDAIKQVNDEVLNLLNTYEGLEVKRDEQGILHITNQEEFNSAERNKVFAAEGAARFAKIREYETSLKSKEKDLNHDENYYLEERAYKPLIEKAIKEGYIDQLASMDDKEITDLYIESPSESDLYPNFNNEDSMRDFSNTVRNYAKQYRELQDAIKTQRTAFGATILENAQIDEEMKKYANTFVNDKYVENLLAKNRENYKDDNLDQVKDKYAEARGYADFKALEGADSTVKDLSKEQMIDYLAGKDALNQANTQLEIFTSNIRQLDENEQALFAEQEGGALTLEQAKEFKTYLNDEEKMKALYTEYGGDEAFGSYEVFDELFNNAINVALNGFDATNFSSKVKSVLDDSLTGSLTSGTFKNFTDNLASIYTYSGEEGVISIQKSIKDMARNAKMGSDELESFIKSINSVDWSSTESIKTLDDLAREYGISEDAIKAFENQIVDLNHAVSQIDLEKLASSLSLAKKISSGEQGRSFTEEQYNKAIESGVDKKDFVYNIETGNYDYIGQDIIEVRDTIISKADDIIAQLKDSSDQAQIIGKVLEGGSTERNNADDLRNFFQRYLSIAGDASIIDWDFIYSASLEEMQKTYDKLMQEYRAQDTTQDQLHQAKQEEYQLNSGSNNALRAANGDEDAKAVLKAQLASSGVSEEIRQELTEEINRYKVGDLYFGDSVAAAGTVVDTFNEAERFGIDPEVLNSYVDTLQQIDGLEHENIGTLYELALANAKYQEGLNNITDSYDDWIQLKREDGSIAPPKDGNAEQLKVYEKLKKDLKEMLDLSDDVADEFLKIPENADLLEKAVNGDIDAISELRANAAKIELAGFDIKQKDQDAIVKAIEDLTSITPDLEIGAKLNDTQFGESLLAAMQAAGMTVTEMQEMFDSLGWSPEIQYKPMDVEAASQLSTTGYQEIGVPDEQGYHIESVPVSSLTNYSNGGQVMVPVIGNATYTKPSIPSVSPKSSSSGSGGGGGSSKSEKKSYWENPYDELYNLQEKINEALRTRESLERRYQKLLKQEQATLSDIRKAYYDQIKNLRTEADLQKQLANGRLNQINKLGSELYTDEDGNRTSFSSLGVTKYASYDSNTGLITIDWEGLEAISNDSSREEEGKAAEEYISKLEELVSSYEEVRDKLWEIEDEIENLREEVIESYLSFEDRVLEGLVQKYQQQIDSYEAMSNAIENANNEVLDSLREQIDLSRQIRDNTEKEENIADMENRLAYLQRDTSGANDLEILKLQKDLDDARQSYTDTLIDQAIDEMQKDADLAAEQRARQIETMNEQLQIMQDTGALWQEVYDLMSDAASGDGALSPKSKLVELLKGTEAYDSLSNIGQAKWWEEVAEQFHSAWVGLDEAEDKYKVDANNDGEIHNSGTQNAIDTTSQETTTTEPSTTTNSKPAYDEKTKYGVALAVCDGYWGNGQTRKNNLESKGFNYSEIQGIVNKVLKDAQSGAWYGKYYGITSVTPYKMSAFKKGGLADFTGPAWLDGTKTNPELILNAQDSRNFIALKDILASLLNTQGAKNSVGGGDNYFDIDINATIGSDYDVDKLKERIKQDIYDDGQYRNVNTINFLR